jgi:PKD repeat protein
MGGVMRRWLAGVGVALAIACGGAGQQTGEGPTGARGSAAPDAGTTQTISPKGATAVVRFDGTTGIGVAPDTERFDGSASTANTGNAQIVAWSWDFGDGATASGPKASHTFAAGKFTVSLTVTDSDGGQGRASVPVNVTAPSTPRGVVAVAKLDGTGGKGPVPDDEKFDGSGSHSLDPNATVSCAWDFGDGATATGCKIAHIFTSAGSFTVTLTAKDSDGATAAATLKVEVSEPPGSTRWVNSGGYVVGTNFEDRIVISNGSSLSGVSPSTGETLWTRSPPPQEERQAVYAPMFISPSSGALFARDVTAPCCTVTENVCEFSSTDGTQLGYCFNQYSDEYDRLLPIAMSPTGELAWATNGAYPGNGPTVSARSSDGRVSTLTLIDESRSPPWPSAQISAVGVEPGGDVLLSLTGGNGFTFDGEPVNGSVLMRFTPQGHLEWQIASPPYDQLASDASGNIVGLVFTPSPFQIGDQTLAAGYYLIARGPNGAPRWARPIQEGSRGLSVLPSGDVAFYVSRANCSGALVCRLSREGALLWTRDFATERCNFLPDSIAILPDDVLVGGDLQQGSDLGHGNVPGGGVVVDLHG